MIVYIGKQQLFNIYLTFKFYSHIIQFSITLLQAALLYYYLLLCIQTPPINT